MVASGVAYVASTLAFTHRMHRTHLDALRLGYENLALLEQVRREKEAAERSNLEKSRFLAAASHDLRQPVLAVSLFLGLLTNEKLTAHGRYLVDNIASATAAMGHLFDALLNISRLDAGVIEPRRKWFPLNPLLEQLRAEYAPQAVQKGLSLRVRPSKAVVNSDPVLLERILRNLISNAIAHTRRGGVLVGCRHRRGGVRILVCDTGPGIPPSEQERVFWEFHQLNNPERDRSKGLGLGWPSCGAPPRCWTIRWSWHRRRGAAPCSRWAWRRAPPRRRWPRRRRRPSPRRQRPPPATRSRTTGAGGWCWWSTTMRRTWPA